MKYDLENIKEVRIMVSQSFPKDIEGEINELLNKGWILLAITEEGDKVEGLRTVYILGRISTKGSNNRK